MSTNGPLPGSGSGPYGQQPPPPQQPPVPPQQPPMPPQQGQLPPQGCGYPQQAYGHPQQPPAAPPGQPGYGYPQQSAPPQYPMAPQPGYGQPGHPQQFPGAPVPGARPRKKKSGLIVLLVVALVVLGGAGGGAWYLMANAATKPLYSVPTDAGWSLSEQEVDGTWFTDKAVVQTLSGGVKAYALDTGKQLWATALPGAGNQACLAPSDSDGGVGIVAYGASATAGAKGKCDHVAAFDLNSGKVLWKRAFKVKDEFGMGDGLSVARSSEAVVIATDTEYVALNVADGAEAWDPMRLEDGSKVWDTQDLYYGRGCSAGTYTGGKNLIRVRSCTEGDDSSDKDWDEVSLIDPGSGKAEWTKRFADGAAGHAVSTSPLVISGDEAGVYALDEKTGEKRGGEFQGHPEKYIRGAEDNGSPMRQAAGFGNIFLMGGYDPDGGAGSPRSMVAYDLDSGKELWRSKASPKMEYIPLRETGGKRLLAYVTEATEKPKLVEFDSKDGAMTTLVEYPEEVDTNTGTGAWPFWHKGVLYVTSVGAGLGGDSFSLAALPTTAS
ncbi:MULTISPECIES: PQQ-binding-like beta-propeller repeat protein [unclassified Streptomyces]|uniref:outer membrane protein assembly factor BamB family protein n=1 Tax=unclassified Streptomyces TaxID=2593676 RepID=UPI002365E61E|nr:MULTISPECIES: PQQ-binding-like beta-propeller repeat protein [unclassified Streptomyces]MDF3140186.1 PQQ-binding-like beta-propeller repeat protein [Streptomyces sp. T21Q-yed]WDF41704.1 PQQ-binding-like beta-propeller repeat protein [Streptomyces sp. T12]